MLDAELQIVTSQVVDVSENAEQLSTAGGTTEHVHQLTIGRTGLPEKATFVAIIEAGESDNSVDPIYLVLQYTPDGTNYVDIATINFVGNDSAEPLRIYSVPVGRFDWREEVRSKDVAILRVAARYPDTAGTDDFTYSAYIAGPNPYPHASIV